MFVEVNAITKQTGTEKIHIQCQGSRHGKFSLHLYIIEIIEKS